MLHRLSFSNFFSFRDKVSIDFTVDKNSPDTDAYFTDTYGNRLSKIMTVVGANASGKTNLLKSLLFIKWFIVDSFSLDPKEPIGKGFKPFIFCNENKTSTFEIVFGIKDELYSYTLELTTSTVVKEILEIKNKDTNHWNNVFQRELNEDGITHKFTSKKLDVPSDFEKLVRINSSVLSAARQINNPYAIKIAEYFSNIQFSESLNPYNTKNHILGLVFDAAEFFGKQPAMKERAEKILQKFDLGLSKFSIQELKAADGKAVYIPMSHHKNIETENDHSLVMFEESGGTLNLFVLLKEILVALDTGAIVIFDELDNNLHALMVPELVNLFRSKNHNPKNAQLFFSTHNVQILNELDKTQIVIVEKDEKNMSNAWKLSDIEDVRSDDNYYTKYLAGTYGGIPKFL